MFCNILPIIGILIAILLLALAYTTGHVKEGFATVARGVPSMTQCQNLSSETACNNDSACIWCKSRGTCEIKGQRTECIEAGDNGDIFQATATSSGLNLRPQPTGTTPTPAAPVLAVSTPERVPIRLAGRR
jgi:hypothetical protein